jgi:hypothetical protein
MADAPYNGARIGSVRVKDGLQNFAARIGLGTDNQMSASTYALNPITRNRQLLDNMYRSSWIVRNAVGTIADDMTRAGIEIQGSTEPEDIDTLQNALRRLNVWGAIAQGVRWGRLYGGAIGVMLLDGQSMSTPLRIETVQQDQFRGLLILDRWLVQPSMTNFVQELGPDLGKPEYYRLSVSDRSLPHGDIHHSRVIRFEGDDLPYYQRQAEMGWGMSIVEPLYERLVAFDSVTLGTAQMVYRAHLRTLRIKNLRNSIATGGKAYEAQIAQLDLIRRYQSMEGLTLLDSEDEFNSLTYTFGGLPDVMMQMAQQVAGAIGTPLVKLFGMSPAGFSTGETDLRSYYDNIHLRQERTLRAPVGRMLDVLYRSELGAQPVDDFGFDFQPLWGLSDQEKAAIANQDATTIVSTEAAGIIPRSVALKELRQSGRTTGTFTNITDELIEEAEQQEAEPALPAVPLPEDGSQEVPGEAGEPGADNDDSPDSAGTVGDPPSWLRMGGMKAPSTPAAPRLSGMPGGLRMPGMPR